MSDMLARQFISEERLALVARISVRLAGFSVGYLEAMAEALDNRLAGRLDPRGSRPAGVDGPPLKIVRAQPDAVA